MRSLGGWGLAVLIMLLLDWYVFSAIRQVTHGASGKTRMMVYTVYWLVSALALAGILLLPYLQNHPAGRFVRNYVFAIVTGLFLAKLVASVFIAVDDIRRGGWWVVSKLAGSAGTAGGSLSRSAFLNWMGLAMGGGLFSTLLYGFSNKYNYQVRRVTLHFPHLPEAFRGLKIAQLSDIHSGSLQNREAVAHGVNLLLQQKPDLVLFTGDLVNDRADEMTGYMDVFGRIQAPMGVYSTLGNHDYGDYVTWPSAEAKASNLQRLKQVHADMGWRLLMNEHVVLERNGQQIALLGIENWGAKGRFPKYGRMDLAYPGTEQYPFKILMSHDPSHWDAEVKVKYPDVDLMLAGHTHGMQFGVELPHFKWSPVQWMYKQWAGLYSDGNQHLYVNRGYGFIGYPGRVGILPEITLIELA